MVSNRLLFNSYFIIITLVGLSLFIYAFNQLDFQLIYVFWLILLAVSEMKPVSLDTKDQVTLSFAIHLAVVMIFGIWFSVVASGLGSAFADAYTKRGWQKVLFNTAQYSLTLFLTGTVYEKFTYDTSNGFSITEQIIPFILASGTYVVVNFLLVAVIVSLSHRIPLLDAIKMDIGMIILFLTSLAPLSLLMVILYNREMWSVVLILPPLALAHNGFENYLKLRKQTRATIEFLADVVDKRDPYTASHSFRVANYALKIGQELGLQYEQVERLVMAGRVHDLGKVGISDYILQKDKKLTELEYKEMKTHPEIGYQILSPLEMYKDVLNIVLYHHERADGKGYPRSLYGKNIPLSAKIISVADSYDAMTTDRPYRKAMKEEEAIKELLNNKGTQFDADVVDAFVRILEREKQDRGES